MINKYFTAIFLLCAMLLTTAQAQFKFGFGLGYSGVAGSKAYGEHFPSHGFGSNLEFGYLLNEHFEPGVRLGNNSHFLSNPATEGVIGTLQFPNVYSISVLPYLRYYFLENQKFRPYVIAGLGYSYNTTNGGFTGGKINTINTDLRYNASSVTARLGGGVRLVKFLDLSFHYAYLGWIDRKFSATNLGNVTLAQAETLYNAAGGSVYKKSYSLNAFELSLSFVFGGNLKKKEDSSQKTGE